MHDAYAPIDRTPPVLPDKRILAIAGSLRRSSWNLLLLEAATACTPPGMTVSVYRDLGAVPLFNEDLEQEAGGAPDAVKRLRREVSAADGVLFATPEYNQSLPGVLKNAIDWVSRGAPEDVLAGKPVAIMGATSGRWGTRLAQHALRQTLHATECMIMPAPALYVSSAAQLFDSSGRLSDVATGNALQAVLASLGQWIDLVRSP
ncbi:NAD(P)H-dependent oxidoreductase [Stenotrophomonas sp. SY1]|jgi:chromate reductase|uniref:NADPH-dependent FMN reductase n=1 Tax=Stenotrophomonas sp. SY1 TaxID=477235 RepID=UPI001E63428A|nr:NAD(P)H-dependent oxidoreductase [Stenotrophomonas sp. SY1]MCD9087092.1 NAD(P)H-dependent oxidoreductase [Stenotrophomonas sp. SY1]